MSEVLTLTLFFMYTNILNMPELSRFKGMSIAIYFKDHNPPHFHVLYN